MRPALFTRMSIGAEGRFRGTERRFNLLGHGDVTRDAGGAGRPALRRRSGRAPCPDRDRDLGPCAVKGARDGETDAAGAAGDEGGLAGEVDRRRNSGM